MRCPICEADGVRHRVYEGGSSSTLMAAPPPYWDEDGNYVVPPDPNIHTTSYTCSNGHRFEGRTQHGETEIVMLDDTVDDLLNAAHPYNFKINLTDPFNPEGSKADG